MQCPNIKYWVLFFALSSFSLSANEDSIEANNNIAVTEQALDEISKLNLTELSPDEIQKAMAVLTKVLCAAYTEKTKKSCCCKPGPRGPQGPRGATGPTGATGLGPV